MKVLSKLLIICVSFILLLLTGLVNHALAQSAILYFSPSSQSVSLNQQFSVVVMVDTAGADVAGVTADFTYPGDLLQVSSIDSTNSDFSIEAEQDYNSSTVLISRATSGGNTYSGVGEVATVNFTAIGSGTATLSFTQDAIVMTGGAEPTNVLGDAQTATITTGSLPSAGLLDKSMIFLVVSIAVVLIFVGVTAILEYRKDRSKIKLI